MKNGKNEVVSNQGQPFSIEIDSVESVEESLNSLRLSQGRQLQEVLKNNKSVIMTDSEMPMSFIIDEVPINGVMKQVDYFERAQRGENMVR